MNVVDLGASKMCRYRHIELALKELDGVSAKYDISVTNSNKIRIDILYNNQRKTLFTSKTPSDINAPKMIQRDARRIILEMK